MEGSYRPVREIGRVRRGTTPDGSSCYLLTYYGYTATAVASSLPFTLMCLTP